MRPTIEQGATGLPVAFIEASLQSYSRIFEGVQMRPSAEGGIEIQVELNPIAVRGRASQQGLEIDTVEAAALDPRLHRMLSDAIERINISLDYEHRIASFSILA